jgi:hypothetical protein
MKQLDLHIHGRTLTIMVGEPGRDNQFPVFLEVDGRQRFAAFFTNKAEETDE